MLRLLLKQGGQGEVWVPRLTGCRRYTQVKEFARRQMVLGTVDGIDGDQFVAAVVEGRERSLCRIAAKHDLILAGGEPDHLKLDVVLVGPKPRGGGERSFLAHQGGGGRLALLDGVLH